MGKCPKCGEKLEYLINYQEAIKTWKVTLGSDGLDFEDLCDDSSNEEGDFVCPNCEKIIAVTCNKAREILEGEDDEKV